jgi:hypothetical protein
VPGRGTRIQKASEFGEIVLDEIWLQDRRAFDLLKGPGGMESTVFGKVWSCFMLSVNAVIMICVRNCRISLTVIVSFPLFLLFGDRRVHCDLVCVTASGMHFDRHLKGINGDSSE